MGQTAQPAADLRRDWPALVAHTLLTHAAIIASFRVGFAGDSVVALWPAAGICAWVAIRYGWPAFFVVLISHQAYSLLFQTGNAGFYIAANIGNATACVAGAWLYRRAGGTCTPLLNVRTTLVFLIVLAGTISAIAALAGAVALWFFYDLGAAALGPIAWRWFFSDYTGIVFITPTLIALNAARSAPLAQHARELMDELPVPLVVSTIVMLVVYAATFAMPDELGQYPIILFTMPLCVWLALKDAARSSVVLLTLTTIGSLALVLISVGDSSAGAFLAVQLYGVVVMSTSLVLRATSAERTAALATLGVERAQLEEKVAARTSELRALAETDTLTGLSNRRSFDAALTQAFESRGEPGLPDHLVYVDLDRFKMVNDTSGHAAGDALLLTISELLKNSVRGDDVIGRLGGDEFAILLKQCPPQNARRIAEALRAEISALRFQWEGDSHDVGASIGVAKIDPAAEDLLNIRQLADAACYTAKRGGRNRVHIASTSDADLIEHRGTMLWAQRLKDALAQDHFVLFAQKIAPAQSENRGEQHVEILLRLRDPDSGNMISPGEFLPAAERYGFAQQVDLWVLAKLIALLKSGAACSDTHYWVNLSGASVGDAAFGQQLRDVIAEAGLQPRTINFEITETAVIRNLRRARELMVRLHGLGVLFALDDFGTGLSSYSHLKALPVDHVKIDGSFIRNVTNDAIDRAFVRSITQVAQTMGLRVVAEWVEDDATRKMASELGADYVQGFGIHAPAPLVAQNDTVANRAASA